MRCHSHDLAVNMNIDFILTKEKHWSLSYISKWACLSLDLQATKVQQKLKKMVEKQMMFAGVGLTFSLQKKLGHCLIHMEKQICCEKDHVLKIFTWEPNFSWRKNRKPNFFCQVSEF